MKTIKETWRTLKINWPNMNPFQRLVWICIFPIAFMVIAIFIYVKNLVMKKAKEIIEERNGEAQEKIKLDMP